MAITYGKNYGRPTLDLNFAENKSLIDSITGRNLITFSRSQSGKEATYVGSDGLIKYAGADEPRFDYDPETGESLGLLIEEQRTNFETNSRLTSLIVLMLLELLVMVFMMLSEPLVLIIKVQIKKFCQMEALIM